MFKRIGSFEISNGSSVDINVQLTFSQPYGRAQYYNASEYDTTLCVEGQETKTVKPRFTEYIQWKKSAFKRKYVVK